MSLSAETSARIARLFNPRSIAIVGASGELGRIGGQPLRALTEFGYTGQVYPVNPKYGEIKGLRCYPSVEALPAPCDLAVIAVPSTAVAGAIAECGRAGIGVAVVLSSGFREIGQAGAALQEELVAVARESGVRLVGPNCQGVMSHPIRMYAGFGTAFRNPPRRGGPLAMVTQSGSFGYTAVTEVTVAGLGFDYVVSTGNEADLSALDLLEFVLEQEDIEVVTAYLEGVQEGQRLLALGERALELGKPILLWKAGESNSGRRAALSHTANITSNAEVYRAVIRQGGFVPVHETSDLTDIARAFLGRRLPRGRNVAVFTTSGGYGVLIADRCEACGLEVPEISEATQAELRKIAPQYAALGNPIDVTAQLSTDGARVNQALKVLVDDPDIHQILVRKGSTDGKIGEQWASGLPELVRSSDKPILFSILPENSEAALEVLNRERLPWSPTTRGLVYAAQALYEFKLKLERRGARQARAFDKRELQWPARAGALAEHESKRILSEYGIPAVREVLVPVDQIAALSDSPVGFPAVVKIASADIAHKTEAGGVRVDIRTVAELKDAAAAVLAAARAHRPDARLDGVLVQEMVRGVEMIVGMVNDRFFGPVIALGLGGVFAETLRDVTHRCAPFDESTARVMIDELKGAAILRGARGAAPADTAALAQAISRLSYLAADHADRITEIDVNPLFVQEHGVVAADALVVVNQAS